MPARGVGWTAPNDPESVAATVARLRTTAPVLIVVEATGGYEPALVAALAAAPLARAAPFMPPRATAPPTNPIMRTVRPFTTEELRVGLIRL